jgi:hypothetical protein
LLLTFGAKSLVIVHPAKALAPRPYPDTAVVSAEQVPEIVDTVCKLKKHAPFHVPGDMTAQPLVQSSV